MELILFPQKVVEPKLQGISHSQSPAMTVDVSTCKTMRSLYACGTERCHVAVPPPHSHFEPKIVDLLSLSVSSRLVNNLTSRQGMISAARPPAGIPYPPTLPPDILIDQERLPDYNPKDFSPAGCRERPSKFNGRCQALMQIRWSKGSTVWLVRNLRLYVPTRTNVKPVGYQC